MEKPNQSILNNSQTIPLGADTVLMRYRWVSLILLSVFFQINAAQIKGSIYVYEDHEEAARDAFAGAYWNYAKPDYNKKDYATVKNLLEPLYKTICAKYNKCDDFPQPTVLLSFDDTTAAFARVVEGKPVQTNILIISNELLKNSEQLEFVLAHELIHYFEEHGKQQTLGEKISAIKKQAYQDCLDYDEPLEVVEGNLIQLIGLIDELGSKPHLISSQAAIPLDGDLGRALEKMIYKSFGKNYNCNRAHILFIKLKRMHEKGNFISSNSPEYKDFQKLASSCFESYQGNLLADVFEQEKLFLDLDPNLWPEIDKIIKNDDISELNRLQTLRNIRYNEYTRLSRELSAPQLRYQTHEDIADIRAIEILIDLGHENIANRLDYLMTDLSSLEQIRCRDDLKNNREPSYGALNSLHHHECWRIWRAQKVEQRYQE